MKLSSIQRKAPLFLLLLMAVSFSLISMVSSNHADLKAELDIERTEHFFCNTDFTALDNNEVDSQICSAWMHYDNVSCNCNRGNSVFDSDKYRRWCRPSTGGWGRFQYSPWVCNTWCRYQ